MSGRMCSIHAALIVTVPLLWSPEPSNASFDLRRAQIHDGDGIGSAQGDIGKLAGAVERDDVVIGRSLDAFVRRRRVPGSPLADDDAADERQLLRGVLEDRRRDNSQAKGVQVPATFLVQVDRVSEAGKGSGQ